MGVMVLRSGMTAKYLERAQELRALADELQDPQARTRLVRAAETYERLISTMDVDSASASGAPPNRPPRQ